MRFKLISKLQQNITTIAGVIVTISLTLISDFILNLPKEITWLTFFIGSIVTITATLLENRLIDMMTTELSRRLEIYRLLEEIKDEELYKRGKIAIERCLLELENLSKGILQLDSGQLFLYLIQLSSSVKKHIRVTHVGLDEKYFDIWKTAGEQRWHQHAIELVQKGITFERIFILSRNAFIDENKGKLKSKIIELLKKQENDGIKVWIAWIEELDNPELIQDFGIFDETLVNVTNPAWSGGYNNIIVYWRKFDVSRYIEIYETLRSKSHTLSELLTL